MSRIVLLDQVRIATDVRRARTLPPQVRVRLLEVLSQVRHGLLEGPSEVDGPHHRLGTAGEVEQAPHDTGDASRLLDDRLEVAGPLRVASVAGQEEARPTFDHVQGRRDLVGDSGGQRAQRGQLLLFAHPLLER